MVDINIYFSYIPGVFGALLSTYNWLQTKKPANIKPNEIVEYAIVSSSHEEADILTIPLVFHNSGALHGVVTDIKVGIESSDGVKYFEIMGRANLSELNTNELMNMGMDKYSNEGYSIVLPTYPIDLEAGGSVAIILIAVAGHDEKIIPLDTDAKWVIETHFGKKKNTDKFDFKISTDQYERAENLRWFRSIE